MMRSRDAATPRAETRPVLRLTTMRDVDAVPAMERAAFPDIPEERLWTRAQVEAHVRVFPEGQWVVEREGASWEAA